MSTTIALGSLDNTFGCLTLGALFSMALWGAGTMQVYYFFDRYQVDSLYLKLQVFVVWAVETAHQALILGGMYRYLVTHYADTVYLASLDGMLRESVILTAVIAVVVQSIFVDRIYCLSKNNLLLTGATAIPALAQLVCTILYYVKIHPATTFEEFDSHRSFLLADKIVTTVANVVIAAALVYLFHATKTGFRKSDSMVNKVTAFVLNTGALMAACAFACMIASIVSANSFIYMLFYFVLVQLYMTSALSSLNSRSFKSSSTVDSSGTPGRNFRMTDMRNNINEPEVSSYSIRPTGGQRVVTIKVDTETILDNDPQKDYIRPDSDHDYSPSKGTAI